MWMFVSVCVFVLNEAHIERAVPGGLEDAVRLCDLCKGVDSVQHFLLCVRSRDLHADARLALWHNLCV